MLTGIHFLLTYKCLFECDHCFVYSSPRAEGTFSYEQFIKTLDQAQEIGTVEWIYFEGGEPFLYYPLLVEFAEIASARGFKVGIVSNAYFATSIRDAERWLNPFKVLNVADLSISNDELHSGDAELSTASIAIKAAENLGIKVSSISIAKPVRSKCVFDSKKGQPVTGGNVMFRGRAADKLASDVSGDEWYEFDKCDFEELINPERVHVDSFGNVQICQGISIGNMWNVKLSVIINQYDAYKHPIVKHLINGGPKQLAEQYKTKHTERYADACHLCYETRKQLIELFPHSLAPKQVYGM